VSVHHTRGSSPRAFQDIVLHAIGRSGKPYLGGLEQASLPSGALRYALPRHRDWVQVLRSLHAFKGGVSPFRFAFIHYSGSGAPVCRVLSLVHVARVRVSLLAATCDAGVSVRPASPPFTNEHCAAPVALLKGERVAAHYSRVPVSPPRLRVYPGPATTRTRSWPCGHVHHPTMADAPFGGVPTMLRSGV
jgi:hypothetical protein